MSRRGTVAALLNRAFGGLVALILVSGVTGIGTSLLQYRSIRELSGQVTPLRLANREVRLAIFDAQVALRGYLLTGDRTFLAGYARASADFALAVRRMRQIPGQETQHPAVDEQARLAARWWSEADLQRDLPPRGDQAARWVERGSALSEPFLRANEALEADLAGDERRLRRASERLRTAMVVSGLAVTALAMLLAAVTAVHTTRRLTRPLDKLVRLLGRLGTGDLAARAPTDIDLAEVAVLAAALNDLIGRAERARGREEASARLAAATRKLGVRVRHHLSVDAVIREAAAGLGAMLDADHVVVRLAAGEDFPGATVGWSRVAGVPPGVDPTEPLRGLSLDWLLDRLGDDDSDEQAYAWNDLEVDDPPLPPEERTALRTTGARTVLAVAFRRGGPSGVVTLIRCAGRGPWSAELVQAAENVTADLSRGLQQARLYERGQDLVARLRDLDRAKTDFMSTVSHELRTPLTSIAGYVEMLADGSAGELNETQCRMLAVIDRNTARLRALIEDLLLLSRIESGTLLTSREDMEYGSAIDSAVAAIAPLAAAAGVSLETDVRGVLSGRADPHQIDRVLVNLLSNAVKFTPNGGAVRVEGDHDDGDVVIKVSDTGIGIPQAEQKHLFTRFFRANNATEQAVPGTGLGLAIVHTIVARHGGRVLVESQEGKGTTVTVRLPP